jgi:type VI secretion system protein
MREQRLLERIRNTSEDPRKRGMSEQEVLIDSVVDYLNRLFNTRRGNAAIDPEFGVPDYSSLASRLSTANTATLDDIETALKTSILKHEPRLKFPRVRFLDKGEFDIALLIEIEAQLITGEGEAPVLFKLRMTPSGNVEVSV